MGRTSRWIGGVLVLLWAFALLGTTTPAVEGSWIIRTVAGGGPDGIPATQANLDTPVAVASDIEGNFYIAAGWAHRVFKVDPAGQISVFAGSGGNRSYAADDGRPAVDARLYWPLGLALDGDRNLYIADWGSARIRKVDAATGIITTAAGCLYPCSGGDGGPATGARLTGPSGVAVDESGNLYIVEMDGARVRKVDAATGVISTFAGTGSAGYGGDGGPAADARLARPTHAVVDSAGNVFISDTGNDRVRRVDALTGTITTVAGPVWYSSGRNPTGLALDGSEFLYIAANNTIFRLDLAGGIALPYVGNGEGFGGDGHPANGSVPILFDFGDEQGGLALDPDGNLFVADSGNLRVRRVGANHGLVSTVAGNGRFGSSGDGLPATQASLYYPSGAVADTVGNLFIAEGAFIRKVDHATGLIGTVAGNGDLGSSGDGGPALEASIDPWRLLVDPAGNVYFVEPYSRVRRIDAATGIITTVAGTGEYGSSGDGGPATEAMLAFPIGLAFDLQGNLLISDNDAQRIRRVDLSTGIISTVAGNGQDGFSGDGGPAVSAMLSYPSGIAVDAAGNLYIADHENFRIRRVDAASGNISTLAGNGVRGHSDDGGAAAQSALWGPDGMAVDAAGNVYFSDADDRVRRVDAATGILNTVAGGGGHGFGGDGGPAASAALDYPFDISIDAAGNLIIADDFNFRVRRVSAPLVNQPPVAVAGADIRAECSSPSGATVTLDGSGSSDPDSTPGTHDDIVSFEWFEDFGTPEQASLGTGEVLAVTLPLGDHLITLQVTDQAGSASRDDLVVTVADTTAPVISVSVSPSILWPPNHQMTEVVATVTARDGCSAPVQVALVSVTGDGSTDAGDVQGASTGTADFRFLLKAERNGKDREGRTYTIVYKAADGAGLESMASTTVVVPHDMRTGSRSPSWVRGQGRQGFRK